MGDYSIIVIKPNCNCINDIYGMAKTLPFKFIMKFQCSNGLLAGGVGKLVQFLKETSSERVSGGGVSGGGAVKVELENPGSLSSSDVITLVEAVGEHQGQLFLSSFSNNFSINNAL